MSKKYAVRGIDPKTNELSYYAVVHNYGGYSYVSKTPEYTPDISTAIAWLDKCGPTSSYCRMKNPEVIEIVCTHAPVDITPYLASQTKINDIASKMTEEEKDIMRTLLK